jgi:hypothetical protein
MYTQTEILKIARNCANLEEVMRASRILRELICIGVQPADKTTNYLFTKRFRELIP